MRVNIIAAVANNGVIGAKNGLPWNLPDDLKRFKRLTMGHPILMGRKTYESIGRPLPGRKNVVISRNKNIEFPKGVYRFSDLFVALAALRNEEEVFVIGGGQIYEIALPFSHRIYLTELEDDFDGDTLFPEFDHKEFSTISLEQVDSDEIQYRYRTLDRKKEPFAIETVNAAPTGSEARAAPV